MLKLTATDLMRGKSIVTEVADTKEAMGAITEMCGDTAMLMRPKRAPAYSLSKDGSTRVDGDHMIVIWSGDFVAFDTARTGDNSADLAAKEAAAEAKLEAAAKALRVKAAADDEAAADAARIAAKAAKAEADAADEAQAKLDEEAANAAAFELPSASANKADLLAAVELWNESSPDKQIALKDSATNAEIYSALTAATES